MTFLDRFFPLELREAKVLEFINLRQGNISMKEYSLKFTQLARYGSHVVADNRSKMSKFVSGVYDSVVKECRTTMLISEMDLSRIMVHAQQIEEQKIKDRERGNKRARTSSFNFNQQKSKGGNRPQFHQRSIAQTPSSASAPIPKFQNDNRDRAPGPKPQYSISSAQTNPLCQKYGRNYHGIYRVSNDVCFGCAKPSHKVR